MQDRQKLWNGHNQKKRLFQFLLLAWFIRLKFWFALDTRLLMASINGKWLMFATKGEVSFCHSQLGVYSHQTFALFSVHTVIQTPEHTQAHAMITFRSCNISTGKWFISFLFLHHILPKICKQINLKFSTVSDFSQVWAAYCLFSQMIRTCCCHIIRANVWKFYLCTKKDFCNNWIDVSVISFLAVDKQHVQDKSN